MSTASKHPEHHSSPESPELTQRELALAWIDREVNTSYQDQYGESQRDYLKDKRTLIEGGDEATIESFADKETQRARALAWIDRELEELKKAYAPYEAASKNLSGPAPKRVNVPDPGHDSGADREDWLVERGADAYEREQEEHLLYDKDPVRDELETKLDDLTQDRLQIEVGDDAEDLIEQFAAKETARLEAESEGSAAA